MVGYYPKPSANGECVIRLQKVLNKKGIVSDVICIGDNAQLIDSKFGEINVIKSNSNRLINNSKDKQSLW